MCLAPSLRNKSAYKITGAELLGRSPKPVTSETPTTPDVTESVTPESVDSGRNRRRGSLRISLNGPTTGSGLNLPV